MVFKAFFVILNVQDILYSKSLYVLPRTLHAFFFMVPKPGVYQKDTNVEIALWPPFQPLLALLQLGYF